jgi:cytidine deaminase
VQQNYIELIDLSYYAQKFSYSPYSKFSVGAALLTGDKSIFTGTNIECASYSLSICAERVVFSKALSEGHREFTAIAISSSKDDFTFPCGACLQFMYEFSRDLELIILKSKKEFVIKKISDLMPFPFTKKFNNQS